MTITPISPKAPNLQHDVIKFASESPQSYSYTLMSPNSLALRLNVLKRSLEILIDHPEMMPTMNNSNIGYNGSSKLPDVDQTVLGRPSPTTSMMDNLIRNDRKASSAALSNVINSTHMSRANSPSASSLNLTNSYFPQQITSINNNNNKPMDAAPVTLDKELVDDLKRIIKVLEKGINTNELSSDKASKVVKLHNLSLSNARQISKTETLRINLLQALATPFMDNNSSTSSANVQQLIGGVPMLNSASVMGLSALNSNKSTSNLAGSQPPSSTRQFHAASTGKNSSPKAIFTCDLESPWALKNANDLALLMFGISRASIRALTLMDLIAPRARDLVLDRLWKHDELVFSGEIVAIKRNNKGMAWTSLWAKRKDDFMILIFEQIPCDSIDIVIEKSLAIEDKHSYRVKSYVENSGKLFGDGNKLSGLRLDDFLPAMDRELEEESKDDSLSRISTGQKDSTLINRARYYAIRIENNCHIPCAITSEPLEATAEGAALIRMNLHSLPYIAGSFVISSKDYRIVSFNNAIAKNLFGTSMLKGKSIDTILPKFTKLIEQAIFENPNLMFQEGIVLPEHYFRKSNAQILGKDNNERELLFLNSNGIDGLHRDGTLIKVDVQLRVIEQNLCILWITYSRAALQSASSSSSSSSEDEDENSSYAVDQSDDEIDHERQDSGGMPSQLRLLPEVEDDLYSCGDSSDGLSRSSTIRLGNRNESGGLVNAGLKSPQVARRDSSTRKTVDSDNVTTKSNDKKKDSATSESSTATKNSASASEDRTKIKEFKLSNILTEKSLLIQENEQIEKVKQQSSHYPKKVGTMRREKSFSNFNVLKDLGQGAYGKVVVAEWIGDPHYKVVIKAIFKERILVDTWVRDRALGTIPSEIQIMNYINSDPHPNIMRIVDFFEDEDCYYLETPQHGDPPAVDLFDLIEVKSDMTELESKYIYYQCCSAMAHLHRHGIVHRDIKDENVIVDKDYVVKLIDFGSAAYTKNGPFGVFVGTIDYAAPEVLNGKPYEGKPQDVWAMGILLYTLVFKENPFVNVDEILDGDLKFPLFSNVSDSCIELIKMMLTKNINERPTMNEVLSHRWLQGFS
ncbi:hypothetical protein CANARDRAFT_193364 [[Candida] arabinofermentans NRRL YB-2248]|uniref:non-specific serine/threonine protein kinase n=1 Tax=[Candida] arabinofermentans NRRL YB-2248 TaxID=983967 RepID=A0A1E4T7R2_9ASCO|nr:hypothetical protein CANARDRAFT_193364 [[Candida] arabinofermentans NRRL YB-2248]